MWSMPHVNKPMAALVLCVVMTCFIAYSSMSDLSTVSSVLPSNLDTILSGKKQNYQPTDVQSLSKSYPRLVDLQNEALWVSSVKHDARCPLGRAIVIPCFEGHFKFLIMGLASIQHFVTDAASFHYIVVVSDRSEKQEFLTLIRLNGITLPIQIVTFSETLNDFYPEETFSDSILQVLIDSGAKAAKTKYQAMKKFYGTLYSRCERTYWLDAEFSVIKHMTFDAMFNEFFARRRFFYSLGQFVQAIPHQSFEMLGLKDATAPEGIWFHESFDWFVERNVLLAMMEYSIDHTLIKRPTVLYNTSGLQSIPKLPDRMTFFEVSIYCDGPIFEYTIYQIFIWANRKLYPQFEWLFSHQVMSNFLAPSPESFLEPGSVALPQRQHPISSYQAWIAAFLPNMGNLEFVLNGLNETTYPFIKEFVEYYHIWSFRIPPQNSVPLLCKIVMESNAIGMHVVDHAPFPPRGALNCSDYNVSIFRHNYIEVPKENSVYA